jgi:hypothetical protein
MGGDRIMTVAYLCLVLVLALAFGSVIYGERDS